MLTHVIRLIYLSRSALLTVLAPLNFIAYGLIEVKDGNLGTNDLCRRRQIPLHPAPQPWDGLTNLLVTATLFRL